MSGFEVIEGGPGGEGGGGGAPEAPTPDVESKKKRPVLKEKRKSSQRKAARFCLNNYNQTAIVSDMLKELEWERKKQQEANCGDKHKEI